MAEKNLAELQKERADLMEGKHAIDALIQQLKKQIRDLRKARQVIGVEIAQNRAAIVHAELAEAGEEE